MNKGVEIILARMDSHPEEFRHGSTAAEQWDWITSGIRHAALARKYTNTSINNVSEALHFLSDEEANALCDKLAEIDGQQFTEFVMKQLLADKNADEFEAGQASQTITSAGQYYANTITGLANVSGGGGGIYGSAGSGSGLSGISGGGGTMTPYNPTPTTPAKKYQAHERYKWSITSARELQTTRLGQAMQTTKESPLSIFSKFFGL